MTLEITEEYESDLTSFPIDWGCIGAKYNTVSGKEEMAVIVIVLMGLYVLITVVIALEGIFVSILQFLPVILNSQMHYWTPSYLI